MTMEEIKDKMEHLKDIFDVVRLVDDRTVCLLAGEPRADRPQEPCECYSFWEKKQPCENCIAYKALQEKGKGSKLEFMDSGVYQVLADYVEVDGRPYVLEMLKKLDENTFLDTYGYEKLMERMELYSEKLYRDALTGAYNRRFYEDEVKNRVESAGVAVIDVDDFKIYNDTYGHHVGDKALVATANVIRRNIRKTDLLIRYGGDEFLLILQKVSRRVLSKKLHQIREKMRETIFSDEVRIPLSVSIGGVLTEKDRIEDAVRRADKMMYYAKKRKNTVIIEGDKELERTEQDESLEAGNIKEQILIADDSEMNRELLSEMLHNDLRILEARNGRECINMLEQYGTGISLVLLDIVMPEVDGFGVLSYMNANRWIDDIPVIMISSETSEAHIRRAYDMGASDYVSRPFDAKVVHRRVSNTLKLYAKQRRLLRLLEKQLYEKEKNNRIMVSILSQIVEFRNGESGLHVIHINLLTSLILERLQEKTDRYDISRQEQELIATASTLHDIGKIAIDEKILNKPGKLTREEFEIMKTHTVIGANMLETVEQYQNEPLIERAHEICRWHHERYDGRGYPDGLKGDEIPISAQVVALADVYDALVSKRVYKPAYSHEKAIEMILNGECGAFNPLLLECLTDIKDQLRKEMQLRSREAYPERADIHDLTLAELDDADI